MINSWNNFVKLLQKYLFVSLKFYLLLVCYFAYVETHAQTVEISSACIYLLAAVTYTLELLTEETWDVKEPRPLTIIIYITSIFIHNLVQYQF